MRLAATVPMLVLASAITATTADRVSRPAVPPRAPALPATSGADESTAFVMRHVRLHASPDVVLDVARLDGHLVSNNRDVPVFDNQQSFHVDVDYAEIAAAADSVTGLVNEAFGYDGAPIDHVKVALRDGKLQQSGRFKKGLPLPFSMTADVASKDGRILVTPEKVRVAGLPAARLMKIAGLDLSDLIKVKAGHGVQVRDEDLLLTPSEILKSPQIRGRVTNARIAGDRLLLVLGDRSKVAGDPAADAARNFIWFRGGIIRFGRLTMSDADLQLIDADPSDPFDFYPEKYNEQLVAGYSRNTPNGALRTMMPDYNDIPKLKNGSLSVAAK